MYTTLINVDQLKADYDPSSWLIIDTRAYLTDFAKGRTLYEAGHIPNAHFLDLENDLSGEKSAELGRHPLPDFQDFIQLMADLGVASNVQVVIYDDMAGAMAGRLWWMLRTVGHDAVAVLDGGLPCWVASGGTLSVDIPQRVAKPNVLHWQHNAYLSTAQLQAQLAIGGVQLVDARAAERFAGEVEPIDPVAGHVPGAINRPFQHNLTEDGVFKSPQLLAAEWQAPIDTDKPVVHMCGSGVTGCHNLLAMAHAGFMDTQLYVGSWSEWVRDSERPVAKGV